MILAKAPAAGRVKTRLCPPCTPAEAAELAAAALADTLGAVLATPAARHVLVLDGVPPPWVPANCEVISQRGDGLDERLAAAFGDVGGPAILVGMDTPQITPGLLRVAIDRLLAPGTDAVLGPAADGGWWAIGLRRNDSRVFLGVPMSTSTTGTAQSDRLLSLGLRTTMLRPLVDVDDYESGAAVAEGAPQTRFAAAFELLSARVPG